jgi:hypothetical protein
MNRRMIASLAVLLLTALLVAVSGCTNNDKTKFTSQNLPVTSDVTPSLNTVSLHWANGDVTSILSEESQHEFNQTYGHICDLDVPSFFSYKKDGIRYYYREAYENTPVEVLNRDNLWADKEKAPRAPRELVAEFNKMSDVPESAETPRPTIDRGTLEQVNPKGNIELDLPAGRQQFPLERFTAWNLESVTLAIRVPASQATDFTPKTSVVPVRINGVPYKGVVDAIQHDDPDGQTVVLSIKLKIKSS